MPWVEPGLTPPLSSPSRLAPSRPHISFPLRRDPTTGKVIVVEQGSDEHVMSQALQVANTPLGYRPERPEFGWPWPDMALIPVDAEPLIAAIEEFVPMAAGVNAEPDYNALANAALGVDNITISVGVQSADTTGASQGDD